MLMTGPTKDRDQVCGRDAEESQREHLVKPRLLGIKARARLLSSATRAIPALLSLLLAIWIAPQP